MGVWQIIFIVLMFVGLTVNLMRHDTVVRISFWVALISWVIITAILTMGGFWRCG